MTENFQSKMREAMRLTQSGDLGAATAAIQAALSGQTTPPAPTAGNQRASDVIDVPSRIVPEDSAALNARGEAAEPAPPHCTKNTIRNAWEQTQDAFRSMHANAMAGPPTVDAGAVPGEQFIVGNYSGKGGARDYKLFIPASAATQPMPLVVMLHGCKQTPDDFAAGTGMNAIAREQGFCVLYPAQSRQVNAQGCWNWFKHTHQARGRGEPAIIAGITQDVVAKYGLDAQRVYVAGLSAGGAMAAIMGATYPDIYAAVGVHSGLAAGSAHDLPSALGAMKSGNPGAASTGVGVPTIIFHGDADSTVHHTNGGHVVAANASRHATVSVEKVQSSGSRNATRTLHRAAGGAVYTEDWVVHGAPHAWSGGSPTGSYTDPGGPNASAEMVRFFMEHPRP